MKSSTNFRGKRITKACGGKLAHAFVEKLGPGEIGKVSQLCHGERNYGAIFFTWRGDHWYPEFGERPGGIYCCYPYDLGVGSLLILAMDGVLVVIRRILLRNIAAQNRVNICRERF